MAGFTGKSIKSWYKDLLQVDNSNSGITTTNKTIKDGDGDSTAIALSDDTFAIRPITDDTTSTFVVADQSGTNILAVDSTNKECTVNGHYVNSQIKTLTAYDVSPTAGYHYPLIANPAIQSASGEEFTHQAFGNGTDPATSLTVTANSWDYMMTYWILRQNITIDSVNVMLSANDQINSTYFHLFSYDIVTGGGTTAGDLSNGTLLAHNGVGVPTDEARITNSSISIDSADVASGKVIIGFVETDTTDDVTVAMDIKYHYNA